MKKYSIFLLAVTLLIITITSCEEPVLIYTMDNNNAEVYILNFRNEEIFVTLNNTTEISIQPTNFLYEFDTIVHKGSSLDNTTYLGHYENDEYTWFINLDKNTYFHENLSKIDLLVSSKETDTLEQGIKITTNTQESLLDSVLDFSDLNKTYEIKDACLGGWWESQTNIDSGDFIITDLSENKMLILFEYVKEKRYSNPKHIIVVPPETTKETD